MHKFIHSTGTSLLVRFPLLFANWLTRMRSLLSRKWVKNWEFSVNSAMACKRCEETKKLHSDRMCFVVRERSYWCINGRAETPPMLSMLSLWEDKWRFNSFVSIFVFESHKTNLMHVKKFLFIYQVQYCVDSQKWRLICNISISSFSIHYSYFL